MDRSESAIRQQDPILEIHRPTFRARRIVGRLQPAAIRRVYPLEKVSVSKARLLWRHPEQRKGLLRPAQLPRRQAQLPVAQLRNSSGRPQGWPPPGAAPPLIAATGLSSGAGLPLSPGRRLSRQMAANAEQTRKPFRAHHQPGTPVPRADSANPKSPTPCSRSPDKSQGPRARTAGMIAAWGSSRFMIVHQTGKPAAPLRTARTAPESGGKHMP